MTVRPDIEACLAELRAAAVDLMTDTCRVTRKGEPVTDPTTGDVTIPETTVYEGRAKRQTYEPHESVLEAAGHTATVQRYSVHFPVGSFVPAVGDVVEWLTAAHDPDLPGTRDRITGLFNKTFATSQRVYVDEVVD